MISDGEGTVLPIIKDGFHPWVSFLNILLIIIYIQTWAIVKLPHTLNFIIVRLNFCIIIP